MKRILYIGEGRGDIGHEEELPGRAAPVPRTLKRRKGKHEPTRAVAAYEDTRGDLVYIVRRILQDRARRPGSVQIEPTCRKFSDARFRIGRRKNGQPHGHDAKLEVLVREVDELARQSGVALDGVVAVADQRDPTQRILEQLETGRKILENQGMFGLAERCAVGVAICEIEAWLLADRKALRGVLGHAIGDRSLPGALESIRDPKSLLSAYIGEFLSTSRPEGVTVDHLQLKRALAENMDPNEVSRLCPRGFGPFRQEVLERLLPLFEKPAPGLL